MTFYEYSAKNMDGDEVSMETYRGKVLLIVNTASKCGFTPQFKELEALYGEYKEKGFEILGFPSNQFAGQDPGSNEEILNFCQLNYGVTFTMFEKIDVNGKDAHPLYDFLKSQTSALLGTGIKWNFTKFLVDAEGKVVERYAPTISPLALKEDIEKLLNHEE